MDEIQNLKIDFKSKSGSTYYYVEHGVYRLSNHWSRVANCRWRLVSKSNLKIPNSNRFKIGYGDWADFYPDNDFEKLYFIEIDSQNEVNYFHKQSSKYKNQLLRTSIETIKTIKQIRMVLEDSSWSKYVKQTDLEKIKFEIIYELISSNATFQEIRRKFLNIK